MYLGRASSWICTHSFSWVRTYHLWEQDQLRALRWLNLNNIYTESWEGVRICFSTGSIALAIYCHMANSFSCLFFCCSSYYSILFYRLSASNICSKGPRNWFRGWNTSISNPASTQGYISLLEDWHKVPICTGDNTSLPGTDVLTAPERCNRIMDKNNPITQAFVFVNPT